MKTNQIKFKQTVLSVAVLLITLVAGCKKDDKKDVVIVPPADRPVKDVSGNLIGNILWDKDTVYRLNGVVNVGVDSIQTGTTPQATSVLTIEAGTVIVGKKGTTGSNPGTLVIHRGSKIYAEGTAANPIIFSSAESSKAPGDWGGLVVCGKATNNQPGGFATLEGSYGGHHGGSDDNDNSGVIKFVRLEYAGYPILTDKEINSLTLGSVGSGTTISYVQASYGLDDAFEWFGGTVNCDHLIAYKTTDDDFDCDFGYRGRVQFAVSFRSANLADPVSGSNSFEVDNDGGGSTNTPFTSPSFSNVSVFGPKQDSTTSIDANFRRALHLRRSNKIKIYNSFFTGFPQGVVIDGGNTKTYAEGNELVIKNSVLSLMDNWTAYVPYKSDQAGFNVGTWFLDATRSNGTVNNVTSVGYTLSSLYNNTAPNFLPSSTSSLLSGASFTGLTGFTSVAYKGAFDATTNWTNGWAEYNPATIVYVR
ncbi:MAG: T9SS C-terminal target domain-containing protein [Saprospirales bacterium]|nr:T9SS C-terminal target domain-containing protein [Saprospirales bacterium]